VPFRVLAGYSCYPHPAFNMFTAIAQHGAARYDKRDSMDQDTADLASIRVGYAASRPR